MDTKALPRQGSRTVHLPFFYDVPGPSSSETASKLQTLCVLFQRSLTLLLLIIRSPLHHASIDVRRKRDL